MIRILHISDYHFVNEKANEFQEIADRLIKALESKSIDLLVFSGDLVFEGKKVDTFMAAYESLIKPILVSHGLGLDRLMLAPGNHDMLRNQEMDVITNALNACRDETSLSNF